ncbi:MAG: 1-acyl-sn-glycerol-3-phosphate acyltransferase [Rhizobiales bacterium]|nr:1-acyl-sn-glycerol-3-phosphate acyltransferase [Hyphomicrobiales bacterium]
MRAARAAFVALLISLMVLPIIVIQWLLVQIWPKGAKWFPVRVNRMFLFLLNIQVTLDGDLATNGPVLIVSSHSSWIDILAINSLGPSYFVAKQEVANWPIFGTLAKLKGTFFLDRTSRQATGIATTELAARLLDGDRMVLFPEGTSSDGNRVLPFKSAIIGAVEKAFLNSEFDDILIQPMAVAFVSCHGIPLSRTDRHFFTWFGDMELLPHIWGVLMRAPVEIVISVGEPFRHSKYPNRKILTRLLETEVRRMLLSSIMGRKLANIDMLPATHRSPGQD